MAKQVYEGRRLVDTTNGLPPNIRQAIAHRDTILKLLADCPTLGKVSSKFSVVWHSLGGHLSIIYSMPTLLGFERHLANKGRKLPWQLELIDLSANEVYLRLAWNRDTKIVVQCYDPGPWEKRLRSAARGEVLGPDEPLSANVIEFPPHPGDLS